MIIHTGYDENAITESISKSLDVFYTSLLTKIDEMDIQALMKSKNPYLYRAKAMKNAQEIIDSVMQAFISSSEETIFGNCFFEPLAIAAVGGVKSIAEGIDVEIRNTDDNILYAVAVKSGTSIYNADSKKRQIENFGKGKKLATQGKLGYEPVIGYAYGQKKIVSVNSGSMHTELAGEDFWTALTGDPDFYKKIIRYMQDLPEHYVERFEISYNNAQNRLVRQFTNLFCRDDGSIDWEKLVEFNSASLDRLEREEWEKDLNSLIDVFSNNPDISKKKVSEMTGIGISRVNKIITYLLDNNMIENSGTKTKPIWTLIRDAVDTEVYDE